MSNKDALLKDIQQHNDAQDMNFEKWMIWGITQTAIIAAMILDNLENIEHKAESKE